MPGATHPVRLAPEKWIAMADSADSSVRPIRPIRPVRTSPLLYIVVLPLLERLLLGVVAALAQGYIPDRLDPAAYTQTVTLRGLLSPKSPLWKLVGPWIRWDSFWYLGIATGGYTEKAQAVFSPLYPAAIHLLGSLTGQPTAAVAISLLAFMGALLLAWRLVEEQWDESVAKRTVLVMLLFPAAFYFYSGYAESLALLGIVGTFYSAKKGQWIWAGLAATVATLSRPVGVIAVLVLASELVFQAQADRRAGRKVQLLQFASLFIPVAAYLAETLYLYQRLHILGIAQAESLWGGHIANPAATTGALLSAMLHGPTAGFTEVQIVANLFALALILVTTVTVFLQDFPPTYRLFTLAMAAVLLLQTSGSLPFGSELRYTLLLFPMYIVLARLLKRPRGFTAFMELSACLLCFLLVEFVRFQYF